MMKIQKKSIEHISKTLGSFDTYPAYKALIDIMSEKGIESNIITIIANKYQDTINEERKKVTEAKSWADHLISDV